MLKWIKRWLPFLRRKRRKHTRLKGNLIALPSFPFNFQLLHSIKVSVVLPHYGNHTVMPRQRTDFNGNLQTLSSRVKDSLNSSEELAEDHLKTYENIPSLHVF